MEIKWPCCYNNNNNNNNNNNVEPEMYDCISNNWSHWNSNEKLKEKFGNCTRKTFDRFTTKDSYTWNITHNMESTAVWSLKRERWGSPLVREKYQEEKACDKRHPYRIIIIIIITMTTTIIMKVVCAVCTCHQCVGFENWCQDSTLCAVFGALVFHVPSPGKARNIWISVQIFTTSSWTYI